jgi:hypothetical protein
MATTQSVHFRRSQELVCNHRVVLFFAATFAISWLGAFAVVAPRILRAEVVPKMTGVFMFPVMLLGPSLTGIVLTRLADGGGGLKDLVRRMGNVRLGPWYFGLLLPPCVISAVLFGLKILVSPVYAPNHFLMGISFGVLAGFLEEIGWMGFAFPALRSTLRSAFVAAIALGLLWGVWHLPVIDYLGTATPHGSFLIPYLIAFIAAMTGMRVLIAWMYVNTKSVFCAQLMHASSTGFLVVLSPPLVTARQEVFWYGVYALALWLVVVLVVFKYGVQLKAGTGSDAS